MIAAPAPGLPSSPVKRPRILLVDDEPEIGAALFAWLERQGYDAAFAEGPAQADALLAAREFDVVLSDIQMPGNFKLEWIARHLQSPCPPPVLLMTGNPELETAMRAANLPVAGYLLKPLFYEEAAATLERLATDHHRRRELLDLANEVTRLLAAVSAPPADPLAVELHRLARQLAAEAQRSPRETKPADTGGQWREAVAHTIAVLEKTKHSFRSKELGELRRRLEQLVPAQPARASRTTCDVASN